MTYSVGTRTEPRREPVARSLLLARLNARGIRLLQPADAVAVFATILVINLARFGAPWPGTYPARDYVLGYGLATAVHIGVFYFGGLYERESRLGSRPRLPRIMALAAVAVLVCGAGALLTDRYLLPRANLAALFVAGSLAVAMNRRISRWMRIKREGLPRVLLVGAPDEVNLARKHLAEASDKVLVAGEAGGTDGLVEHVEACRATDVLLLSSRMLADLYPEPLETLEQRGYGVLQVVGASDSLLGLRNVREIGGMPFVALYSHVMPRSQMRLKRVLDLTLLLLAAPFALVLAGVMSLYVLAAAGRPVLFHQRRIGQDGRLFSLVKFRTMYRDAERLTGPIQATKGDPRVVPALRWVRETRLDELPQLWNVLRGEMSVVGPRPERPEMAERFASLIPGYHRRNEIPPGITGLAQVHGRYHTDPEYKLGHDLQYLVNYSPVMDVQILLRTVWVVVSRRV